MTGGQSLLALDEAARERAGRARARAAPRSVRPHEPLRVVAATTEELAAHAQLAALLQKPAAVAACGCSWSRRPVPAGRAAMRAARIHRS